MRYVGGGTMLIDRVLDLIHRYIGTERCHRLILWFLFGLCVVGCVLFIAIELSGVH